jgi:hypothetical protein
MPQKANGTDRFEAAFVSRNSSLPDPVPHRCHFSEAKNLYIFDLPLIIGAVVSGWNEIVRHPAKLLLII